MDPNNPNMTPSTPAHYDTMLRSMVETAVGRRFQELTASSEGSEIQVNTVLQYQATSSNQDGPLSSLQTQQLLEHLLSTCTGLSNQQHCNDRNPTQANVSVYRRMNTINQNFKFPLANDHGSSSSPLARAITNSNQGTTDQGKMVCHIKALSENSSHSQYSEELVQTMVEEITARKAAKMAERRADGHVTPPFKPSRMALEREGLVDDKLAFRIPNHPYKGDMNSGSYLAQVDNLPFSENCAYWITNIPQETTETEIFAIIKTGAVRILHVNPPDATHETAAAKLVFMTVEGGHRFFDQCTKEPYLYVRGSKLSVVPNRNGYKADSNSMHTRILLLEGPLLYMTEEFWARYFKEYSVSKLECVRVVWEDENRRKMEFRFCRIDGQAETCYLAIRRGESVPPDVKVMFGRDPCDPKTPQFGKGTSRTGGRGGSGGGWSGGRGGKSQNTKPKFDALKVTWRPQSSRDGN